MMMRRRNNAMTSTIYPEAGRTVEQVGLPRSRLWSALASFETLFLLYLLAGRYKGMPEFAWFPIDFTVFFLMVSVGAAVILSSTRVNVVAALQDHGIVLFLAFVSWIVISLLWSSYVEPNVVKTLNTVVLLAWCFLGGYLFVAEERARVRRFLIGLTIASILLLLYWAYYRFVLGVVDVDPEEEVNNYLVYSYHAQYAVAVLIAGAIASRSTWAVGSCMVGVIALYVVMLFIGGRGPLFFAVLTVPIAFAFLLIHPKAKGHRSRFASVVLWLALLAILLLLLAVWLGPYMFAQLSEQMTTLGRLTQSLGESDLGGSVNDRVDGQAFAIEHWMRAPIVGWGIGEFEVLYPSLKYPHNLFLEILMELGLVGFWLLVILMALGTVRAWDLWPRPPHWAPIALVLLFVTQLLSRLTVQGFLPDERVLFALLGIILGLGYRAGARL